MKKTINSVLASGVTAVFCVTASVLVVNQSKGTFSLMDNLDVFALNAVLFFLIYYFFKPVRFYLTILCLLAASALYAATAEAPDGRLLLVSALFICMGVASVFVKKVFFFPLKKMAIPLGGWMAVFVLLEIILELVSGGSITGMPVKSILIAFGCGVILGVIGLVVKAVLPKSNGVSANRFFLVDAVAERPMPKAQVNIPRPEGAGSVALPKRTTVSSEKDDVKKSILDAKLAAMCGGQDDKKTSVSKSTAGSTQPALPKTTTETGKIVSSVDFS